MDTRPIFYNFVKWKFSCLNFFTMKNIKAFFFIAVLFLTNAAQAQTKCPDIRLSSPDLIKEGDPVMFTAMVTGGDGSVTYSYNWSVSSGSISSGQGTTTITVDTKGLGGQSCTATVELGGLDRTCSSTASSTVSIDMVPKTELHIKGDFSTALAFTNDAKKFAGDLMSAYYAAESTRAVVFLYPGKGAKAAAAIKQMTARIKKSFTGYGMKPAMYKIKTAGKRAKTSYEMWIVPKDGEAPVATPVR